MTAGAGAPLGGLQPGGCRLASSGTWASPTGRGEAMSSSKSIQFILTRQLASCVAAPILLVDAEGALIYYNEPAEAIFNQRFDETGEMPASEWTSRFTAVDDDRNPIPPKDRPMGRVLAECAPVSRTMWMRVSGGDWRHLNVTAFPLVSEKGQLFGAMSIFWAI